MDFTRSVLLAACTWALLESPARAIPEAPTFVCSAHPDAYACQGQVATCTTCHTSTWPVAWNAYGAALATRLSGADDRAAFEAAILALDEEDSDADNVTNGDELVRGTNPGDGEDVWPYCVEGAPAAVGQVREGYDFHRASVRASVLYCGHSPDADQLDAIDALARSAPRDAYAALHTAAQSCLDSPYWRDEGVRRLGDPRIRPIASVGQNSPVGIVIGDYEWDYRLFAYVLTGDRDARDLLRADYHVRAEADGTLTKVEGKVAGTSGQGPEPLEPGRRAGMITTQWFFAVNTMFSPLPRTTAAQALRAYLGLDLSKQQGISPLPGEPRDVDQKGVREPQCAACHSTLDPLSYAFAPYEGIRGAARTGTYDAGRPARLIEGWPSPQGALLGEPVDDLLAWAEVARESDAFARNLAAMFFRHAFEREPAVPERADFEALWRSLPDDGYSANRLIHRLIDLDAFGGLAP